jgi:hypothetical protein
MTFVADLEAWARSQGADVVRGPGGIKAEWELARRRQPGAMRHLRYRIELEVDTPGRTVLLSETLWERGPGDTLDLGADLRPRDEAYRVGTVWERSVPQAHGASLAMLYALDFDFDNLKHRLEKACQRAGFRLRQLIPL